MNRAVITKWDSVYAAEQEPLTVLEEVAPLRLSPTEVRTSLPSGYRSRRQDRIDLPAPYAGSALLGAPFPSHHRSRSQDDCGVPRLKLIERSTTNRNRRGMSRSGGPLVPIPVGN